MVVDVQTGNLLVVALPTARAYPSHSLVRLVAWRDTSHEVTVEVVVIVIVEASDLCWSAQVADEALYATRSALQLCAYARPDPVIDAVELT